jgi:flagellar biosynthesis chaperone FliJ
MAPFQYRLQPLLDLKLERRKRLETELVERQLQLAAEHRVLAELGQNQEALAARLVQALRSRLAAGQSPNGYTLGLHTEYLRGLGGEVEAASGAVSAQQLRVREFQDRVTEARCLLAESAREVEVLTRHRERLEKRFLRTVERKESMEQDEMGSIMTIRKRRAHESSL